MTVSSRDENKEQGYQQQSKPTPAKGRLNCGPSTDVVTRSLFTSTLRGLVWARLSFSKLFHLGQVKSTLSMSCVNSIGTINVSRVVYAKTQGAQIMLWGCDDKYVDLLIQSIDVDVVDNSTEDIEMRTSHRAAYIQQLPVAFSN